MERTLLKTVFSLFLLLLSNSVLAQQEFVTGALYDSKTNEPISFATIRVKGYAIGVITNLDGGFRVPLKFIEYGEVLEISSMGYLTKEISLSSLSLERVNVVRMDPGLLALNEVVVKGKVKERKRIFSARQIVEEAIENIPRNYPMDPFSTVGYYRDYQFENGQYLNLNEAILEVFDMGYGSIDTASTKALLYDLNQNENFYRDTTALEAYDYIDGKKVVEEAFLPAYGGNEFAILRVHDAIRNHKVDSYSFIHRFDADLLRNHIFTLGMDTYFDGENLYTVRFVKDLGALKPFRNHSAYGTMYVSKRNFAIHRMEYSVYNKKRRLPKGELNRHGENSELVFEVNSEYRSVGDKMFLNYISFYNTFQIRQPPKFKTSEIIVDFDKRRFLIRFNNAIDVKSALRNRNYEVTFKGAKLRIDKIIRVGRQVHLFPKLMPEESKTIFNELRYASGKNRVIPKELLSFKTENIFDTDGNKIHEWSHKDYNQFREFFVQEVKTNAKAPPDSNFMDKRHPIFKDQPVLRPENFDQYWMNTPLQKSEH